MAAGEVVVAAVTVDHEWYYETEERKQRCIAARRKSAMNFTSVKFRLQIYDSSLQI
jgi:hypothetical protein